MNTRYKTLQITIPSYYVYHVELKRPNKMNSINDDMWNEIKDCFDKLSLDPECRAILLSGQGKLFCAGLDLFSSTSFTDLFSNQEDIARRCRKIEEIIKRYQDSISSLEKCVKPVIACVHNACIGAGVDLISAADIRLCSQDAWFQIKEVDIGMAADVGTLQRFPKIIGSDSLTRELCYTARKFTCSEALSCGFISKSYETKEIMMRESIKLAELIASKSPVAVQGTKRNLVYSRDHSVKDSLDYMVMWNQSMLQSEDLVNAVTGQVSKTSEPVLFSKL